MNITELDQFTGTETWYRHNTGRLFTDGIKYLAEKTGAYWLIDEVFFSQEIKAIKRQEFQVWTLKVKDDEGRLICDDGNDEVVYRKKIVFTDFPLKEIKLYYTDSVLMLRSEY
jgi:hypothetical protein